ncbi:IclR family transcriptional regulator [Saccharopolyspora sp. K220]|uniref:IclR family transcriptional regulator n=1 Tax=Saccharopolyspora soli TaxID=2926618 RepID=UPI001F55BB4E|nr:IclR family transcriptional regulator [Saccharopolyspora soli]MCI2423294.1 IclR family transcriptional regulator [Saccharopolyspora soli]
MPRVATGESVLARAVRIFEAFTSVRRALTLSELARLTGLPIATTSRLVAELARHGLLTRDEEGRIRVGVRMWELAQRASPTLSLREAAMPFLEDVHTVVGQHVQFSVLDGDEVLFLERLSAPGAVINYTQIAGRLPLHASSSGLVLLAHAQAELQERVLAGPLQQLTPHTVTDPGQLRGVLAEVRRQGHVVTDGYIHVEATGVAVPVRGRSGEVVAALSVIVPNDGAAFTWVPVLCTAANGISRTLSREAIQ